MVKAFKKGAVILHGHGKVLKSVDSWIWVE